ncbi:hypothetical protein BSKO_05307 [Bryopsis sp. KO-2023]|nr:hypothetical protein BSKO_05307 [Bryopsis sp. KO-2023]
MTSEANPSSETTPEVEPAVSSPAPPLLQDEMNIPASGCSDFTVIIKAAGDGPGRVAQIIDLPPNLDSAPCGRRYGEHAILKFRNHGFGLGR